jgi:hypothetical protein
VDDREIRLDDREIRVEGVFLLLADVPSFGEDSSP